MLFWELSAECETREPEGRMWFSDLRALDVEIKVYWLIRSDQRVLVRAVVMKLSLFSVCESDVL